MTSALAWRLRKLRPLDVRRAAHPRGAAHLSAASALVRVGNRFHVVADDEHHLASFGPRPGEPIILSRLFPGTLPDGKKKRKKAKPDLECLAVVPPFATARAPAAAPALLAFGSGSRPKRERVAWLALDAAGMPTGRATRVDLQPLYAPLRERFAELNIEGAFVVGDELRLLQRGNGGDSRNACIAFAWRAVAAWLAGRGGVPRARRITDYALGRIDDVPWGFTDGTPLAGGGWAFAAVAEATDDAYADAPHRGSALGIVDAAGEVVSFERASTRWKVEGIAAAAADGSAFHLVSDADDPHQASWLLRASRR